MKGRFRGAISIAILVALPLGPGPVRAAPAVVSAAVAEVRSAPSPVAPVIGTLPQGQPFDVSPQVENGWRQVRLSDGRFGYVEDAKVSVSVAPAGEGTSPAAVAPPAVPLRSGDLAPAGAPPPDAAAAEEAGRRWRAEMMFGFASLVGELGVGLERRIGPWFTLEGAAGLGIAGPQLGLMPRISAAEGHLRPYLGVGTTVSFGSQSDQGGGTALWGTLEVGFQVVRGRSIVALGGGISRILAGSFQLPCIFCGVTVTAARGYTLPQGRVSIGRLF